MDKEEVEIRKIYSGTLMGFGFYCGLAFYERENEKLRLLNFEPIEKKPETEKEKIVNAWFKIFNLDKPEYSPELIRGKIILESENQINIESEGKIYYFEKTSEEEFKKYIGYIEGLKESARSKQTSNYIFL